MDPSSSSSGSDRQDRVRQQRVVADLGNRALECTDLDRLFRDATEAVQTTLETDTCKLLELLPGEERFLLRDGCGWNDGVVGTETVPTNRESQAGHTLETTDPVVVDDLQTEDRFAGPDLLLDHDIVSGISAVVGPSDDPWGVLGTHTTTRREFSEGDAAFVQNVANVLASAVERDRANRRRDEDASLTDTILETSPIGITIVDADGEMRFTNERAEEIFGRSKARIDELSFDDPAWDEVGPDGEPLTADELPFRRIAESGEQVFDQVTGVLRSDGERVWVSVNGAPVRDEDRELDAVVFAIEDVTDRFDRERDLERYETVVETAHDGIYVLDDERRFELVNDSFAALTGFSRDELHGTHASVVFGEEFASIEADQLDAAASRRSPTFEETIVAGPDETDTRTVENRFAILSTEDGTRRIGVVRDITERKEMEAKLRESEERFRTLSEHLEEVVWMTGADPESLSYINPAYEEVWGLDRDSLYDDALSFLEVVHPDDRERVREAYTGLPEEEYDEEFRIERPDGERRWIHGRATPVRSEDGTVDRIVGIDTDVTRRKERERALEESEQRYRTVLEHFPNGAIALFDEDLRYSLVGGQALGEIDLDASEVVGATIEEFYPDEIVPKLESACRGALEGDSTQVDVAFRDRDWSVHAVPVRDTDADVFAGMLMAQDVTERKEYQRRLEESNERLEQFAYVASHDLQEPLRMISSYLGFVQDRYGDELDDDGQEFVEFAVEGADRMREMIDGLLEFSRVETRGDPLEPIELDDSFADARRDLKLQIEEQDAEITAEPLPRVVGDGNQLRQVFQNLLSNAIEYSGDEQPRIDVSAHREGSEWVISVEDDGIGIDPADTDRIFGVFERLHAVDEHSGSGIGLALCERIVERHGGEIWVESEPGEGSTFSFTLPAHDGSGTGSHCGDASERSQTESPE
ncbi:PAS domain S-box protein [Halosolutus halophilus]|uniref:PAS domain S-box protein n=1 Tax=Halosolutus halophilus TaxID=1552990 RepID=UPI0022350785|nr:PAS domain S-box protein [Halosolutus halophilus]